MARITARPVHRQRPASSRRPPSRRARWLLIGAALLAVVALVVALAMSSLVNELATAVSLTALVVVVALRRQQAEKALDRSEANLRVLIERSPDPILVHREQHLLYANPAAAAMLEYGAGELEGRALRELLPRGRRSSGLGRLSPLVPATDDVASITKTHSPSATNADDDGVLPFSEQHFLTQRGREIVAEVSSIELELDGERAVVSIARDVTERTQMRARLVLADRMASIGTLAAGVAHEVNNPLAYLVGNLAFAVEQVNRIGAGKAVSTLAGQDEHLPDRIHELSAALADAQQGAERVAQIVKELRTFSRADENSRGPVNVHQPLDTSIHMTRTAIEGRAKLIRAYGEVPPVDGNESRLGQVFVNLLINAAQALPERNPDTQEIRVTTGTDDQGRAVIAIADTGPGIPPAIRERIFDPFFTTKPIGVGTGLGLSICHTIITGMGGEISVDSEPGAGTTFTIRLPPSTSARRPMGPVHAPLVARRRARVLVIDDEPLLGESVRRALSGEHDIVAVTSARVALDLLASGESFDVVLCDVLMPRMDGTELYTELKRDTPALAASIVFMSGGVFTPAARAFLEAVPNLVLEKPLDLEQLRGVIRSRL